MLIVCLADICRGAFFFWLKSIKPTHIHMDEIKKILQSTINVSNFEK